MVSAQRTALREDELGELSWSKRNLSHEDAALVGLEVSDADGEDEAYGFVVQSDREYSELLLLWKVLGVKVGHRRHEFTERQVEAIAHWLWGPRVRLILELAKMQDWYGIIWQTIMRKHLSWSEIGRIMTPTRQGRAVSAADARRYVERAAGKLGVPLQYVVYKIECPLVDRWTKYEHLSREDRRAATRQWVIGEEVAPNSQPTINPQPPQVQES